jgi:hypothetical protein
MTSTNIYGYEDTTTNDYGYGDASPDTYSKLGYEATPCDTDKNAPSDTDKYGYGPSKDESDPYGYGDSNGDNNEPQMEQPRRRERPQRRCSVTKYTVEEVQERVKESMIESSEGLTDEEPSSELSIEGVRSAKAPKSTKKRWFSRKK